MSPDFPSVLADVVKNLPFRLDFERGPWICGGALVRAYLGESLVAQDVDIMFRNEVDVRACRSVMEQLGWREMPRSAVQNTSGSNAGPIPGEVTPADFLPPTMWSKDGIPWCVNLATGAFAENMPVVIKGFDLRCCALVSDGESVVGLRETFVDLELRRLFVRRPTRSARIEKYITRGFTPMQFTTVHEATSAGYVDDVTPWLDLVRPERVARWFG